MESSISQTSSEGGGQSKVSLSSNKSKKAVSDYFCKSRITGPQEEELGHVVDEHEEDDDEVAEASDEGKSWKALFLAPLARRWIFR
mmetsp:Transcript_52513/g.132729  ORF Transcript_52513/g.132729 Transcript_52513/m.132729 type:complete len:86 (-) Transcript_52513:322-579(-)